MPAAGALMEMAAECGGATPRNGQQPFDVLAAKIHWRFRSMKAAPALADEIGHLKGAAGSACLQALRDVFVSIGWRHCASGCLERARRWFSRQATPVLAQFLDRASHRDLRVPCRLELTAQNHSEPINTHFP